MHHTALQITGSTQSTKTGLQTLREGQILRGVVQVEGNKLLLSINGVKIPASTELKFQSGQMLWLQVVDLQHENVVLKIVSSPTVDQQPITAVPERALVSAGITPSPLNIKIVEALMAQNLPVTLQAVEELRLEIVHLPKENAENYLEARVWSKDTGIEEKASNVKVVTNFLLGQAEPEEIAQALKLINQSQSTPLESQVLTCLWWQNGEQHGEVYFWTEEEQRRKLELPFDSVILHFYTQNLGELWIRLSSGNEGLALVVYTEDALGQRAFQAGWPSLSNTLLDLGYDVKTVSYQLGQRASFLRIINQDKKINYSGIDLRV